MTGSTLPTSFLPVYYAPGSPFYRCVVVVSMLVDACFCTACGGMSSVAIDMVKAFLSTCALLSTVPGCLGHAAVSELLFIVTSYAVLRCFMCCNRSLADGGGLTMTTCGHLSIV
jgi:hypothetical protein